MPNLVRLAQGLEAGAYSELERPARYTVRTVPRQTREDHKGRIVPRRRFRTLRTVGEAVAELDYRPTACGTSYRLIVLRKLVATLTGEEGLSESNREFFSITNRRR